MTMIHRPFRAKMREAHPADYVKRRLSSFMTVGAAFVGILSAAAAEAAGLPRESALAVGLGTFLALSVVMSDLAIRRARGVTQRRSDRGSMSMQLGPDPEQVIGRITGART